ncbi:MAG: manganese-binding transcriptional regulator MntR [Planctomycetes bacterium]|nr:manganese-binding transcriptional regulator MntR [Planctomycetota bacterium]
MPLPTQPKTRRNNHPAAPNQTFRKVRTDHATETAQDYVEAVSDIVHNKGECRVKDLSELLGVSHVTVSRAIARFQRQRLISTEPHRPIRLTAKGERLAAESRRRHEIVLAFLEAIGVPKRESRRDAEGIEHHVGQVTLRCMERFVQQRRRSTPKRKNAT